MSGRESGRNPALARHLGAIIAPPPTPQRAIGQGSLRQPTLFRSITTAPETNKRP